MHIELSDNEGARDASADDKRMDERQLVHSVVPQSVSVKVSEDAGRDRAQR